jgi:hypothetical protein
LCKDDFGKSMAAFTSTRSSGWAPRHWLGAVRATTKVVKGTTIKACATRLAIRATTKVVKGTTIKACAARLATASSVAVLGELGINSSGDHGVELGGCHSCNHLCHESCCVGISGRRQIRSMSRSRCKSRNQLCH